MQPNTITLAVDPLNNGTTTDQLFTRQEELVNRSTYRGPGHTLESRNMFQLYRTSPKRVGNFLGSAKVSSKFTEDFAVTGADGSTLKSPAIGEVSFSLPVGMTAAQKKAFRQKLISLIDLDTVQDSHQNYQEI
jgi:hypothetical protein